MKKQSIKIVKIKGLKQCFLGGCYDAYVVVNDKMEYGCLPGEKRPYIPYGGKRALNLVLDILEFKPFYHG